RMAAREDQPQPIVVDAISGWIEHSGVLLQQRERGELVATRLETRATAQEVDGFAARGGDEPRARVVGDAVRGPALDRDGERLLKHLLGEIEVAEEAD